MSTLKPFLAEIRERLERQVTQQEFAVMMVTTAATDLKTLVEICEKQRTVSKVISEGDTVFKIAVSRVENCRCQHETCDLCVLSRAIINVVENSVRVSAECDELIRGKK